LDILVLVKKPPQFSKSPLKPNPRPVLENEKAPSAENPKSPLNLRGRRIVCSLLELLHRCMYKMCKTIPST